MQLSLFGRKDGANKVHAALHQKFATKAKEGDKKTYFYC